MKTPLNQGILQSDLAAAGYRIGGLIAPSAGDEAANKDYVDAHAGGGGGDGGTPTLEAFTRYSGNPIIGLGWGSPGSVQVEEFMPFVNPLDATQLIALFTSQPSFGVAYIYYATSPASDGYTWTIGNGSNPIIHDQSRRADSVVINGTNIRLYSTKYPGDLTHGIDMFELTFTGLASLAGTWTLHSSVLLPTGSETEVSQGAVLKDGSNYYLYYSYRTASAILPGIRVCTSSDGITWTRANGGADIISRGLAGSCDATFFEFHQIQKFGNLYVITGEVFGGPEDGHADGSMWSEAMYYSTRPTSGWARNSANPVFSGSLVAGDPDRYHVATPWWAFIDGTWRIFYQASNTDPSTIGYISATWTVCTATLSFGTTPADLIIGVGEPVYIGTDARFVAISGGTKLQTRNTGTNTWVDSAQWTNP